MLRNSNTRLASLLQESMDMNIKFDQKSKTIRLILSALIGFILFPIQTDISSANTGDIFSQPTASFAVNENIDTTTAAINLADSVTISGSPTYTITGTDSASFYIDPSTGILNFINTPDFDSHSTYSVDIVADNGATTDTLTVNINILNILWNNITQSVTIAENIDTSTSIVFDSATATGATSFSLGGTDSSSFTLDSDGNVYFLSSPDYETKNSYSFELGASNGTTVETVTITVSISNVTSDDPVAPAPAPVYIPKTPQASLVLTTSTNKLEWGSQGKLSVSGGSGTGKITYSSRGSAFCAVDKDGNFTPINSGTCKITATKEDDGTYASATSNTVEIVATDAPVATTASSSTSNSGDSMSVGTPVGGVSTVKFAISDTYAGQKVSVVLATKNSAGKTLSKTLGSAKVGATGAVTFKTKVKLPVGAVLKLKSAGSVIFSKTIE